MLAPVLKVDFEIRQKPGPRRLVGIADTLRLAERDHTGGSKDFFMAGEGEAKMRRILIIGCPGSGKTTLAVQMAQKLRLPLVHLDRLNWQDGWQPVPREVFDRRLAAELAKPTWIIDGNFNRTLPLRLEHCDTVVYLDYARWRCLLGVIKRVITCHGKSRPDMGGNCPERFDPAFLRYVWSFRKKYRNQYRHMLDRADHIQVIRLKNRGQASRFLQNL